VKAEAKKQINVNEASQSESDQLADTTGHSGAEDEENGIEDGVEAADIEE
jgi:hypothetical protein